jgi:hypothetical protein
MKTSELIRLLQEADPSGDVECCIDNHDIYSVERWPAFYDGALEILIRDPSLRPYYEVIGGIIRRTGQKIRLRSLPLEHAVWDARGQEFSITIEETDPQTRFYIEQEVQRWRDEAVQARNEQG